MFHVDWCKVCQRTFPKFAAASDLVHEQGIKVDFAHVDCTDDKSLCQRYHVTGYPTIKFFQPEETKEPLTYRSLRTEEGFVKFAKRMTEPMVLQFKTEAELAKALANETLAAFVAALPSDRVEPEGLLAASERWRDRHLFAAAPRLADLLPEAAEPGDASLAVLSPGRQQWPGADNRTAAAPAVSFYHGSLDNVKDVLAWVQKNRFPGIWALDETTFYEFTHASRKAALTAFDPAKVTRSQEANLRATAEKLKDDFVFGVLDGVAWSEELLDFNLRKQDLPRVLVTEDDPETWVEDIDALQLESLEKDLRKLLAGAPLLRQTRGMWSKLFLYKREALRLVTKLWLTASESWSQAAFVAGLVAVAMLSVAGFCWCVCCCCRILLTEDSDFDHPGSMPAQASRPKKD